MLVEEEFSVSLGAPVLPLVQDLQRRAGLTTVADDLLLELKKELKLELLPLESYYYY